MFVSPDKAQRITSACIVLHNYLLQKSLDNYAPAGFTDTFDASGNLIEGGWRNLIKPDSLFGSNLSTGKTGRISDSARRNRIALMEYFNSEVGKLAWQN